MAATGEEALEKLEELEMIFGAVAELGGLERCTSLRSLTRERCNDRRATFVVHTPHERFSLRPLNPLVVGPMNTGVSSHGFLAL